MPSGLTGCRQRRCLMPRRIRGLFPNKVHDRNVCPHPDRELIRRELARTDVTPKELHAERCNEVHSKDNPFTSCDRLQALPGVHCQHASSETCLAQSGKNNRGQLEEPDDSPLCSRRGRIVQASLFVARLPSAASPTSSRRPA